uniref:Uncharacterized protein LOC111111003 isoform X3 n=1 Tax=Crassostrea virginica TaxID=6565 RepID=A0A8B8BJ98_CRAVI|nr:uncharacterized protein LOC111111003 isoform X3 [Crassostrea virginica]
MASLYIVSMILVTCLGSVGLGRGDEAGQEEKDKRLLLSDPQVIQAQLEEMQRRIQALEARGNVQQVSQGTGSVYTVWGRKSCPSVNGTTTVYTGITGGKPYDEAGGGITTLCLPHDPEDAPNDFPTSLQVAGRVSHLYGSEYQFTYRKYALDDDVPCAVCRVESATSVLMIPAKSSCPNTWNMQYRGFLVSDASGNDYR